VQQENKLGTKKATALLAGAIDAFATLGIFFAVIFACVFVAAEALAADAPASKAAATFGPKLIQEEVRIPARGGYQVAATILRPAGPGPYGAVILNHGVPGSEQERLNESAANDFAIAAPVFARRGYVVVMPMRRGFGATGGEFAEDAGSCRKPDYVKGETAAAEDVMAAYDYARKLPYVDGSRMILAGQSAGGIVSMFAGARSPEGLVAVLGFAAGRGGNPDIRPGVPCAIEPMAKMFEAMGKQIKVPVLMHYAENDKYFNPATTRLWHERFTAAGARAEYVMQPAFGKDGHYLFGELIGVRYWLPAVEKFLAANHIAFEPIQTPGLLMAAQPPMQVATDSCKSLYRVFIESPGPRAYAVSGDGRCGFAGGLADARETALRECRNISGAACALYAVDSEVVWKAPEVDVKQASTKSSGTASTGSR
jgi:dienelactone hydrolase